MNSFGGNWTYQKIKIIEDYAKAYLQIMKNRPYWKLMYFDGFAGSGDINIDGALDSKVIEGAAKKIVAIKEPKIFDICYFVELDKQKAKNLQQSLHQIRKAGVFVVEDDCNRKLKNMSHFLKSEKGKNHKVLAFIDPCGMEVDWASIECLKGLSIDMWILIPTGIGVNRMLTKNHKISEAWWAKLEAFFGISREILDHDFYTFYEVPTLFGDNQKIFKKNNGIKMIEHIYLQRLNEVFDFVSKPYILKNKNNSIMFHFVLASNNQVAINIANDLVKRLNYS
ncbi:three-Cys-motif partner protein TcmP [Sphingobacterium athyrii]|uniref:Three-Cys-motif partner protein TcmP n=1 Tax=Sphingobacterium athyrii TaxID=2152717 RepID=A0A363NWR4_9SPHI|nr:three-Cys-motif partner protein TcmP [Sphingobacterium athyrii]PUV25148.1 hypothetical protein DCO56_09420 [Sphingobacterium athyrii]